MASKPITAGTILKLVFWSLVVGAIMFQLEWSTGDIFGWIANKVAAVWDWFADFGLNYVLLGATIVIPIFLFSRFRAKMRKE
jgi:hypothetical protein